MENTAILYNLSGLGIRVKYLWIMACICLIALLIMILHLNKLKVSILNKKKTYRINKKVRNHSKEIAVFFIFIVIPLICIASIETYYLYNPTILEYDGYFIKDESYSHSTGNLGTKIIASAISEHQYTFSNYADCKSFYSYKKIMNEMTDELETGQYYRVYYEKSTKIIVRIEEI